MWWWYWYRESSPVPAADVLQAVVMAVHVHVSTTRLHCITMAYATKKFLSSSCWIRSYSPSTSNMSRSTGKTKRDDEVLAKIYASRMGRSSCWSSVVFPCSQPLLMGWWPTTIFQGASDCVSASSRSFENLTEKLVAHEIKDSDIVSDNMQQAASTLRRVSM